MVVPLVGAALIAALPAAMAERAKELALAFSVATLAVGIGASTQFELNAISQFQLTEVHEWIPSFGVSYALGVAGIALSLILMSAILTPVCILAAWHDVPEGGHREKNYFALMLSLLAFMVGVFAATLVATGCRVWGVEGSKAAVGHARRNVPKARFFAGDVERTLRRLPDRADLVVLDPPRTGAGKAVMTAVARLRPRAIAYVACDPAALARDLGIARASGYEPSSIRGFDLFGMTHHLEAVAILQA